MAESSPSLLVLKHSPWVLTANTFCSTGHLPASALYEAQTGPERPSPRSMELMIQGSDTGKRTGKSRARYPQVAPRAMEQIRAAVLPWDGGPPRSSTKG